MRLVLAAWTGAMFLRVAVLSKEQLLFGIDGDLYLLLANGNEALRLRTAAFTRTNESRASQYALPIHIKKAQYRCTMHIAVGCVVAGEAHRCSAWSAASAIPPKRNMLPDESNTRYHSSDVSMAVHPDVGMVRRSPDGGDGRDDRAGSLQGRVLLYSLCLHCRFIAYRPHTESSHNAQVGDRLLRTRPPWCLV